MSYSDLSYVDVMRKASLVNACGSDFWLVAPKDTMIKSSRPVLAVCAVRTGAGKSQTTRYIAKLLRKLGLKVVIIRHPMPYGVLRNQVVERFKTLEDLDKYKTTLEEREDYEPHIKEGFVVYAGVDYEKIIRSAEKEADVILWDGGNNDAPFICPDLLITVADPLRAGNELTYYPGETVARIANALLINKVNSADTTDLAKIRGNLREINPSARVFLANSEVFVDNSDMIRNKRVLLVEDGPTITHGGMAFGAATVAAKKYGAGEIVDASRYVVGEIEKTFKKYPKLKYELPAVGYSKDEVRDLERTINRAKCDVVLSATPTDLKRIIKVNKPIIQVIYELAPIGPEFEIFIKDFARKIVA